MLNLDYATLTAFGILANTSIQAGFLILLIGFLLWVFRIKSLTIRYSFWMIALFGTAVLPLVGVYVPSFSFQIKRSEALVIAEPVGQTNTMPAEIIPRVSVVEKTAESANPPVFNLGTLPSEPEKATGGKLAKFNLFFIITLLWLIGVLFMLLRLGKGYIGMRRLVANSDKIKSERLSQLIAKLNIKRKVELFIATHLYCPVSFGLFSPKIFLPQNINFSEAEFDMVLGHELAHIKRWDCLVNLLQRILEAIFFFHPLIIFASRRLTSLREHICDDYVIEMTNDRVAYAKCLTRLFENTKAMPHLKFSSQHLISDENKSRFLAKMAEQFPQIRRRVTMILDDTRKLATRLSPKAMFTVLLIGCLCILLAGMAKVNLLPEDSAEAKESTKADDTTKNPGRPALAGVSPTEVGRPLASPTGDYSVILHAFASRPKDAEEIARLVSERIREGIQNMRVPSRESLFEGIPRPHYLRGLNGLMPDAALLAKLRENNPEKEIEHLATYRFNMKSGKRNELLNVVLPQKLYRWLGLHTREARLGYLHLWHPELDREVLIGFAANFEGGKLRARYTIQGMRQNRGASREMPGLPFDIGKVVVIGTGSGSSMGSTHDMTGKILDVHISVCGKTFNSRTTQDFTLTAKDLTKISYVLTSVLPQADADFVPPGGALSLTGMPPAEGKILAGKTPAQRKSPKVRFGILNLRDFYTHSHTEFAGQHPGFFWDMSKWWFDRPQVIHDGAPFHIHQGDLDIVVPGKMPEALWGEEKLHLRMEHISAKAKRLHLLMSVPLGGHQPIPFIIHYADGTQSIVWARIGVRLGLNTTTSFVPLSGGPEITTGLCYHETLEIPHPERTIRAIEGQGRFILIAATLEF